MTIDRTITVTLTSANMGDVDETDFDLWATYVGGYLGPLTGYDCTVEQARFGEAGDTTVEISGPSGPEEDDIREAVTEALRDLWETFSGSGGPWEILRTEHDAKAKGGA